ncbi:MAG: flagellar basal body-associated FliL family protein [Aliidongia sp.]
MRPRRIILIVALLVIVGGLTGGFYFRAALTPMILGAAGDAGPPTKRVVKPDEVAYCDLPDIMVTLDNRGLPGNHVVKLSVSLELDDRAEQPRVQAYIPRVIDVFQVYIRQLSVEDVTGVPKIQQLRKAVLTRINAALEPTHVDDVLFREVLVQ